MHSFTLGPLISLNFLKIKFIIYINLDKEVYLLDLIKKDINSKLYLENGFYFDYEKDKNLK